MSKKLFDFAIGNPPYQESNLDNNRQSPVYNLFMDEAFKVADCVEVITPARFLFDVGQTPKAWNEKMLNDEHFKVLQYESDASKVFPSTEIKGGVAVTIRNESAAYGKIGVFTEHAELNSIVHKVAQKNPQPLSTYAYAKSYYGLSALFYKNFPEYKGVMTSGNEHIIDANIFEKMPSAFKNETFDDCAVICGRQANKRVRKYISRNNVKAVSGIDKYKVFVAGANGSGKFGEELSTPFVGNPYEIATQTFMTFGFFDTEAEANNLLTYIKTKFARCMLGVLKVTQNNPRSAWEKIPVQDFTASSDIDWSKSIPEIDRQLYAKYGLSTDEIEFIESHVKEMI